ncbi:MAG: CHAD domain-containing protein [Beijerinckiaceae bacterium]|nr:MAG: CHAD domain-containing protein [Beijerinckiaceae bacterium]
MRVSGRGISLRFALPPENAERFAQRLDQQGGVAASSSASSTIYLDTAAFDFAASGMSFGIAREAQSGRRGWKRFVAPLSATTPGAALHGFKRKLRDAADILVVARAETQHRTWVLALGDDEAQLRLDNAKLHIDGREVALATVTCTSDALDANLVHFIERACQSDTLRLTGDSDAQSVYRLCGALPPYVTASTPDLDAGMGAAQAFRVIAGNCLDQFLLNEAAIRATGDREAVHQCRVALRRLSACFGFFKAFADGADYRAQRQGLKKINRHLGVARDLDILIDDVIAPALAVDPPPGADALMQELGARRAQAHADLAAALDDPASAILFLRLAVWVQAGEWTRSADSKGIRRRSMPIADYVQRKFKKLDRKFACRCATLEEATQEERHRTRIQAKNLRYDAEFLQSLARRKAGRKRLRRFVDATKELQTVLGDWNDVAIARGYLGILAAETGEAGSMTRAGKAGKTNSPKRSALRAAAAEALVRRIEPASETEFREKSAKAGKALAKLRPFWTRLV